MTLHALLAREAPAGVRQLRAATAAHAAAAAARRHGWRPVLIDGTGVASRAAALAALGSAVGAPGWWGGTWDALADVLGDPGLSPGADAIVWAWPSVLADAAPAAYDVVLDVLREACAERAGGDAPLLVLLCDAVPLRGVEAVV